MKTLKALVLFCLTILSQVVFAGEWHHQELRIDNYRLKISYTKRWVTPTYGTNGGVMTGKLFIDVYGSKAINADKIDFFEGYSNGSMSQVSEGNFMEDSSTHQWVQLDKDPSYAGTLSIGKSYFVRLHLDGKRIEFKVKLN